MRGIVTALVFGGLVFGGVVFVRSRGISLPRLQLPGKVPQISINSSASGEVLGAQAPLSITHFGDRFAGVGKVISNLAGTLGVQTVKTGETIINNVNSTPSSSSEVIDMSKVVGEISSKIESIPGNLVNQAKLEYCRQVFAQATASATKQ